MVLYPVSYTHLDVYKRQTVHTHTHNVCVCVCSFSNFILKVGGAARCVSSRQTTKSIQCNGAWSCNGRCYSTWHANPAVILRLRESARARAFFNTLHLTMTYRFLKFILFTLLTVLNNLYLPNSLLGYFYRNTRV